MFVDTHPDGLVLTEADDAPRFGRSMGGVGRMAVIVLVLLVAAASAGLLALLR
jgi:hypothetical protein